MENKGFTLLELMVTVTILLMLAGIFIPKMLSSIEKSKDANLLAILSTFRSQINVYKTDNEDYLYLNIQDIINDTGTQTGQKLATGTSGGALSTLQGEAGTVKSDNGVSIGYGEFLDRENIVEYYYNSNVGTIYIDGVSSNGTDYTNAIDTKNKKWVDY